MASKLCKWHLIWIKRHRCVASQQQVPGTPHHKENEFAFKTKIEMECARVEMKKYPPLIRQARRNWRRKYFLQLFFLHLPRCWCNFFQRLHFIVFLLKKTLNFSTTFHYTKRFRRVASVMVRSIFCLSNLAKVPFVEIIAISIVSISFRASTVVPISPKNITFTLQPNHLIHMCV